MAKTMFKMKFGGYDVGKGKESGKEFRRIKLLEEIDNFAGTRKEVNLITVFADELPADIEKYKLYDDVVVVLEVSASGNKPKFLSMEPYKVSEPGKDLTV